MIFLTVAVNGRRPLLNRDTIYQLLKSVWSDAKDWKVGRYVLLPDHVHLFCAPVSMNPILSLPSWITYWKRTSTRRWPYLEEKPVWQREYWDRQLRSVDHYESKWNYVFQNPVRAGLVKEAEDWPYQGVIENLEA
ncbi:MAG: transposase [Candidatus Methylacidiphilales bacterium]|nr:transposase [Candidatus Methylacidiphilales bacterium]